MRKNIMLYAYEQFSATITSPVGAAPSPRKMVQLSPSLSRRGAAPTKCGYAWGFFPAPRNLRIVQRHIMLLGLLFSVNVLAATPQEMLKQYETQAKQENPAFSGFSAERGASFFRTEHAHSSGQKVSCSTCHTADPRNQGKTRANKVIEPMAIVTNPQRFTDAAKVEKWFGRNCKDVLERACTAQEKGDYIQYLVNVK